MLISAFFQRYLSAAYDCFYARVTLSNPLQSVGDGHFGSYAFVSVLHLFATVLFVPETSESELVLVLFLLTHPVDKTLQLPV